MLSPLLPTRYNQGVGTRRLVMRILALFLALSLVCVVVVQAQQPVPGGQLPATTVQLPSFSVFSVNTTVSVPDRGGMYLGGVSRARDESTTRGFGPLANRGIGSDRAASGVTVHATIHDLDELDKAVLADAAAKRGPIDPDLAKAELIRRGVGKGAIAPPGASSSQLADSVAAIRAKNAVAAEARGNEAAELFAKAEASEAEGKTSVAKIYYLMVTRRDAGQLKQLAESCLARLSGKSSAVARR
jgi:hypothetical protein